MLTFYCLQRVKPFPYLEEFYSLHKAKNTPIKPSCTLTPVKLDFCIMYSATLSLNKVQRKSNPEQLPMAF